MTAPESANSRLSLIVRAGGFQLRLLADGLRDLLLSPLSFGAAVLGLLVGGDRPQRYFDRLMRAGRRSEEWINLFGRYDEDQNESLSAWEARVLAEIEARAEDLPQLREVGKALGGALDQVNQIADQQRAAGRSTNRDVTSTD